MASRTALARVESLTWVFLYGGLLALVLGLAAHRLDETAGWSLIVGGSVVAAAGVLLIWLRSRMKEDAAAGAPPGGQGGPQRSQGAPPRAPNQQGDPE